MKAYLLYEPGEPAAMQLTDIPLPVLNPGELMIKVRAISVNPVDVKTRSGKGIFGRLKTELPIILGWDISGQVEESADPAFQPGDEVFGMVNFPGHGKAYAQYVVAPASQLVRKPENIAHEEAAAATLAALTAYQGLTQKASVKKGDRVLIHAASGGVGHYAVQIAKALGAYVIGTSSAKNREFVLSIGADEHIDYHTDALAQLSDIDFALDAVGGDTFEKTLPLMKKGGTLISIPTGVGEERLEKCKEAGVNGFFFLVESNGIHMAQLANWLEPGILKSHIHTVFDFENMADAHMQVETGRTVGKVVVTL